MFTWANTTYGIINILFLSFTAPSNLLLSQKVLLHTNSISNSSVVATSEGRTGKERKSSDLTDSVVVISIRNFLEYIKNWLTIQGFSEILLASLGILPLIGVKCVSLLAGN